MNTRIFLSLNLIVLAFVLVFLPKNEGKKGELKPKEQIQLISEYSQVVEIDYAARYLAEQNSDIQFIDLRSVDEFLAFNIPGSINIPYEQLFNKKWQGYLNQTDKTNILYGNADFANSGFKGSAKINEWLGISPALFSALLILMAVAMFWVAEKADIKFARPDIKKEL
ncbi:unnamed protein product [marine sediment metagenome]|uniref:Rhodanese domain-containing protein n=2 Tax=marine sediment metagenome TaxID=412755 RepID=X1SZF3_9ZZZZ